MVVRLPLSFLSRGTLNISLTVAADRCNLIYLPNINPEASGVLPWQANVSSEQHISSQSVQNAEWTIVHFMLVYDGAQSNTSVNNMTLVIIQLPQRRAPSVLQRNDVLTHIQVEIGFPFQVTHNPNLLLIPVKKRLNFRLFPTVLPKMARYCERCGKSFDQVTLETLGEDLAATAYEGETARDQGVRSRALVDGLEAAFFRFERAGLSEPQRCDGAVEQL